MPQDTSKISKVDIVAKKLESQVNSQIKASTPLQFIKTGVSTSYSEQNRLAEKSMLNSSTSKKPAKKDSSK